MTLNIKNPEASRLARELARATGKNVTQVVTDALRHQADVLRRDEERRAILSSIEEIQAFVAALPVRDARPSEEVLGYDGFGLPS